MSRTVWGEEIDPASAHPDYPRPSFVRDSFINLNGVWEYCFSDSPEIPSNTEGKINVPFPPESELSGVGRALTPEGYLWYFRSLPPLDPPSADSRLLLHFTAVDQIAQVYVNRRYLCTHIGGYLPFTVDATSAISLAGENTIAVRVQDTTDTSYLSRGLQSLTPSRGTYPAMSGIWQSVWAEWVPPVYVRGLLITPEDDLTSISVRVETNDEMGVTVDLYDNDDNHFTTAIGRTVPATEPLNALDLCKAGSDIRPCNMLEPKCFRASFRLLISDARLWSPDDPYLYRLRIKAGDDQVFTYFAMRHIRVKEDVIGTPRVHLNNKPLFIKGVVSEGFWSDSLLTAPCEKAFLFDLTQMKSRGFNLVRLRLKIEPPRFYYLCDCMGMLVMQDMVNGGMVETASRGSVLSRFAAAVLDKNTEGSRSLDADRDQWEHELRGTLTHLSSFPSIAAWNLFDEGKGQYDTNRLTLIVNALDPSRPISQAIGGNDMGGGDIATLPVPKNNLDPVPDKRGRALIYSNAGAFSFPGQGFSDTEELNEAFTDLMKKKILPPSSYSLAGFIYTRWSDFGEEVNGIFTSDRKSAKIYRGTEPVNGTTEP